MVGGGGAFLCKIVLLVRRFFKSIPLNISSVMSAIRASCGEQYLLVFSLLSCSKIFLAFGRPHETLFSSMRSQHISPTLIPLTAFPLVVIHSSEGRISSVPSLR